MTPELYEPSELGEVRREQCPCGRRARTRGLCAMHYRRYLVARDQDPVDHAPPDAPGVHLTGPQAVAWAFRELGRIEREAAKAVPTSLVIDGQVVPVACCDDAEPCSRCWARERRTREANRRALREAIDAWKAGGRHGPVPLGINERGEVV